LRKTTEIFKKQFWQAFRIFEMPQQTVLEKLQWVIYPPPSAL
jgi:hypothetical protein